MHPPDTTTMQEIRTEEKDATLRPSDQKHGQAFAASSRKTPNGNVFGTYNSVGHQLPLFNLLWAFFGGRQQGTTWLQLSTLMENISIVSALMLALVSLLLGDAVPRLPFPFLFGGSSLLWGGAFHQSNSAYASLYVWRALPCPCAVR